MILPRPILRELGVETGAAMDVVVEGGRVIATPIRHIVREGWEADAQRIGAEAFDVEADEWLGFGNVVDAELEW